MIQTKDIEIFLASSSPRRISLFSMLLSNFGLKFHVKPANIEEYIQDGERNYGRLVKHLANLKASFVSRSIEGVVLGADTIVVINNRILGKPGDASQAERMLKLLSGKWHIVYTGISLTNNINLLKYAAFERTRVKFRNLTRSEIDFYVKSGSPFDKAGAYGIQDDFGSTFIERISGDYFNVVGLPIVKTYLGLKKVIKLNI